MNPKFMTGKKPMLFPDKILFCYTDANIDIVPIQQKSWDKSPKNK